MNVTTVREWYGSESELVERAGVIGAAWCDLGPGPLLVGLEGDLGSGKTTWVRGLLSGLGHRGRVPSPTYTLVESYVLGDLSVMHVDLYRLADASEAELDALGLREWLSRKGTWVLVEWPGRSSKLAAHTDLSIRFEPRGEGGRELEFEARSVGGSNALGALESSSY